MKKSVWINGVEFKSIKESSFKKIVSDLQFFMVSQSGEIEVPGNIYFFTNTGAWFMKKEGYADDFIDKLLSKFSDWHLINLCFFDFLIINPKIYDSLIKEISAKNIRDYWFETAIGVYKDKYWK